MPSAPDNEHPSLSDANAGPPKRPWVRPVLIEYGHLAKLTRGTSGNITELSGKKKGAGMCL